MITLHSLRSADGSKQRRKRVGRGRSSGHGKTSTRGTKGQMSRSGHKHKPTFEGGQMRLVRRIPKRGFNNAGRVEYVPVNLAALDRFDDGSNVTLELMRETGVIRRTRKPVKILGSGEINKKLTVHAHAFSSTAQQKIVSAGGTCEAVR